MALAGTVPLLARFRSPSKQSSRSQDVPARHQQEETRRFNRPAKALPLKPVVKKGDGRALDPIMTVRLTFALNVGDLAGA
jgi:hypothetical protein